MTEPLVGVVMGSASDRDTMQHCANQLEALGVKTVYTATYPAA